MTEMDKFLRCVCGSLHFSVYLGGGHLYGICDRCRREIGPLDTAASPEWEDLNAEFERFG